MPTRRPRRSTASMIVALCAGALLATLPMTAAVASIDDATSNQTTQSERPLPAAATSVTTSEGTDGAFALAAQEEFFATPCAGSTATDPTTSGPAFYPNLLLVSGERLDNFNAGHSVPLYDAAGFGDISYPPLCAVFFDAASGLAVSEWMFCTDIRSSVCGDVGPDGALTEDLVPVQPVTEVGTNPRLSSDQERVISWLIHNGFPFNGDGYYSWGGVTNATAAGSTNERYALQTLIWCVSDPVAASATGSEAERATTCEQSLPASEQERLLDLALPRAEYSLAVTPEALTVPAGETARVTVRTNVFETAITLASDPSSALTLCDSTEDATFVNGELVIGGTSGSQPAEVDICVTPSDDAAVTIAATVTPPANDHLIWNQSSNNAEIECQVFAGFRADRAVALSASATISTIDEDGPDTTTEPTDPSAPGETVEPSQTTQPSGEAPGPVESGEAVESNAPSAPAPTQETATESSQAQDAEQLAATGHSSPVALFLVLALIAFAIGAGLVIRTARQ
ncbi:Cys-Gln thioester bond-forming surface protein [Humidisolicoccus flavus]|uniref:thioester domain-containing protein n=1 Tax=Humidisolicoccus flavus TaxID=3111414 RepID=UPI00324BB284